MTALGYVIAFVAGIALRYTFEDLRLWVSGKREESGK